MFQLSVEEWGDLRSQIVISKGMRAGMRSQIVTSNARGGTRYTPYVFTEQGVAMLSSVLSGRSHFDVLTWPLQAGECARN